ncbi:MAG TPA: hypothetical protein VEQ38_08065 [Verrucomicrobiae bacterium]|nr:hypothetical protein [Verrucomicrobiae bacterium]
MRRAKIGSAAWISPFSMHHDFATFRIIGDLSKEMKVSRQDGIKDTPFVRYALHTNLPP